MGGEKGETTSADYFRIVLFPHRLSLFLAVREAELDGATLSLAANNLSNHPFWPPGGTGPSDLTCGATWPICVAYLPAER